MVKLRCDPDSNYWGKDSMPTVWEYGFEEAHMPVDEIAGEMRNIMLLLGYLPSQIADVFDPELVKQWGYEEFSDAENGSD